MPPSGGSLKKWHAKPKQTLAFSHFEHLHSLLFQYVHHLFVSLPFFQNDTSFLFAVFSCLTRLTGLADLSRQYFDGSVNYFQIFFICLHEHICVQGHANIQLFTTSDTCCFHRNRAIYSSLSTVFQV